MKAVTISGWAETGQPLVLFKPCIPGTDQSLLSVELATSHRNASSALLHETDRPLPVEGGANKEVSGYFNHYVKLSLQPTLFRFDEKVAIKLAELFASLGASFNTE